MNVLDRIANKEIEFNKIPRQYIPGRYIFIDLDKSLSLNGVGVTSIKYLVPNKKGLSSLKYGKENNECYADVNRMPVPDVLNDIADELPDDIDWNSAIEKVPLVRDISKKATINEFERYLEKWLFHIEEIFRMPESTLDREHIKMPVSRAKKVSTKAVNYLAAHSEDWNSKRVYSVIPKNIISEVINETFFIYENCVVVKLVDHILQYLNKRRDELKKLVAFLGTLNKILDSKNSEFHSIYYWKYNRMYSLCGDAYLATEERNEKTPKALKQKIESLLGRLLVLKEKPLYGQIPRNIIIERKLQKTNLLENGEHYKYVKRLWEKWAGGEGLVLTEKEVLENHDRMIKSFNRYVYLLFLRAFNALGYQQTENDAEQGLPVFDAKINLFSENYGQAALMYNTKEETMKICFERHPLDLQIIPVPYSIVEGDEISEIEKFITNTRQNNKRSSYIINYADKVLIEKEVKDLNLKRKINVIGNDIKKGGIIPVSPDDVESAERIERLINWYAVTGIVKKHETVFYNVPYLEKHYKNLSKTLKGVTRDKISIDSSGRSAKVSSTINSDAIEDIKDSVNKRAINLKRTGEKKNKQEIEELEKLAEGFFCLLDEQRKMSFCLRCPSKKERDFEAREDACFVYRCSECHAEWGVRKCKNCSELVPYTKIPGDNTYNPEDPFEMDRLIGRDVLAYPVKEGENYRYVCYNCGNLV